jgi:hypothetical protein
MAKKPKQSLSTIETAPGVFLTGLISTVTLTQGRKRICYRKKAGDKPQYFLPEQIVSRKDVPAAPPPALALEPGPAPAAAAAQSPPPAPSADPQPV